MIFHPDVFAVHAEFGGDLKAMQALYDRPDHIDRIAKLEEENARLTQERQDSAREWRTAFDSMQQRAIAAERALAERAGGVRILQAELDWYSRTEHGTLDGIPYPHVAHVIRVMLSRLTTEPAAPDTKPATEYHDAQEVIPAYSAPEGRPSGKSDDEYRTDYEIGLDNGYALRSATTEGRQEAVAFASKRDMQRLQSRRAASVHPSRHASTDTPLYTRPAEQAVTEAMVRIRDYADKPHADRYVIRNMAEDSLKAAMEAGRQALASKGGER